MEGNQLMGEWWKGALIVTVALWLTTLLYLAVRLVAWLWEPIILYPL
jgi:hypothetical protein